MPFKKGVPIPGQIRFVKGVSGNPKGKPHKLPQLDKLLAAILGDEKEGITAAHAILSALRSKAIKGDVRAAEVLLDRAYGKSKESLDVTTNGESINTGYDLTKLSEAALKELANATATD